MPPAVPLHLVSEIDRFRFKRSSPEKYAGSRITSIYLAGNQKAANIHASGPRPMVAKDVTYSSSPLFYRPNLSGTALYCVEAVVGFAGVRGSRQKRALIRYNLL